MGHHPHPVYNNNHDFCHFCHLLFLGSDIESAADLSFVTRVTNCSRIMSTWRSNINANSNANSKTKDDDANDDWETDPDFVVSIVIRMVISVTN